VLHRPYKDDAYLTLVHGVKFDMVIVNLYDFAATVADKKATHEQIVEKIDIGGPTLLRAAAKNHANCIPVCDPRQYPGLLRMFNEAGRLDPDVITLATREELSCAVFINTSAYDEAIKQYWQSYAFSNLPG
jgi:phosphoribosylaminoimidazolecarboxamide formyltransferase/IMP cyclohydrolase